MASANLFSQYLQQPRSVIDYENDYAKADALKNQNAMQSLSLQQAASVQQQRNALRDLVQSGQIDLNDPNGLQKAVTVAPDVAPALAKSIQDQKTSAALAAKDTAQAGNFTADSGRTNQTAHYELLQHGIQSLTAASTPDQAKQAVIDGVKNGYWSMQDAQAKIAQIPSDPAAYQDFRIQQLKAILPAADLLKANMPTVSTRNTGGTTDTIASDPLTGATRVVNAVKNTTSPDTLATQAGENNRAAQSRATQLTIAGVNQDGSLSGNTSALVDQLGKYNINPSLALQRLPLGQRSALVAQVQAKYPDWDETQYDAKKGAAAKFTYGDQGNQMRSNATASAHLDQLEQLATAVNNGDLRLINQIGNAYGIQSGAAPAQVFNAVKNIVGQEVVKSIVSGGGGEGERKAAADAFDVNSSPQQFLQTKGAIKHVMKAQNDNLLAQRRAAGLSDSTLPNYNAETTPPAAAAIPPDIQAIIDRHGKK